MTYYCLRSGPGDPEVVNVCVRSFIRHNVEIDDATGCVGGGGCGRWQPNLV